MFRVLSDEEAKKVTRWKAPELSNQAGHIAATRKEVMSRLNADSDAMQQEGKRAKPLATGTRKNTPVAKSKKTTSAELASKPAKTVKKKKVQTASIPVPHPSADMMQTSYDEGYALGYGEGLQKGSDEGQQKGLEEGHSLGFAEGNSALHQKSIGQLNAIITKLGQANPAFSDEALEQELLQMSLDIARLVIRRELSTSPEALMGLVKAGLEQLDVSDEQADCTVHLHPLDAQLLRDVIDSSDHAEIIDDPSLEQGDCVVKCGASTVHAGAEDWLNIAAGQIGLLDKANDADSD